nr:hypothetical protein [Tanacetum cinerariifolium]
MHNMGKTIGELHAMLIEYEKSLLKKAKTPQVIAIRGGKIQKTNKKSLKAKGKGKDNDKGKDKQVYIPKPKNHKPSAKENLAKDDTCHHYKEVGYWKRKYPIYLAELLKKKSKLALPALDGTLKRNGGESFWEGGDDFGVGVLRFYSCLTEILGFLEKFEWWFEQDIGGESEDDKEKKLVIVNEEEWMS